MIPNGAAKRMARIQSLRMGREITLIREGVGDYNEFGEYIPATPTTSTIRAVTQPLPYANAATMRASLPEGFRISDYRYVDVYTDDPDLIRPMRVGDPNQTGPDVLEFDGLQWDVVEVMQWWENGHLSLTVVRKDAQNG